VDASLTAALMPYQVSFVDDLVPPLNDIVQLMFDRRNISDAVRRLEASGQAADSDQLESFLDLPPALERPSMQSLLKCDPKPIRRPDFVASTRCSAQLFGHPEQAWRESSSVLVRFSEFWTAARR
jgi:hypothetical protein